MKNLLLFTILTILTAILSFAPDTSTEDSRLATWESHGVVKVLLMDS